MAARAALAETQGELFDVELAAVPEAVDGSPAVAIGEHTLLIPEAEVIVPPLRQELPQRLSRMGQDVAIATEELAAFLRNPELQRRFRRSLQDHHREEDLLEGEELVFISPKCRGRELPTTFIVREGAAGGPVIYCEHGLGGNASNFDLLKQTMPDATFITRNRYPKAEELHPDAPRDIKRRFYHELHRCGGIVEWANKTFRKRIVIVGHSHGTDLDRALSEEAHDDPRIIGGKRGTAVTDVIKAELLITPPALDNGAKGNQLDVIPGVSPEITRQGVNVLDAIVYSLDSGSRFLERNLPTFATKLIPRLSPQEAFNLVISGSLIANKLGHPEYTDQPSLHHSLADARRNHSASVVNELKTVVNGDRVYRPRGRRRLSDMPRVITMTGDNDALVGRGVSKRVSAELKERFGPDRVAWVRSVNADHGLLWDTRYIQCLAELLDELHQHPSQLLHKLARPQVEAYRLAVR